MYVLHEFEDAIGDCLAGNIFDNEANEGGDSPHAWDEGWAFYAGSLEGTDGSGSGQMIHQLAEKRCKDFGTCYTFNNDGSVTVEDDGRGIPVIPSGPLVTSYQLIKIILIISPNPKVTIAR